MIDTDKTINSEVAARGGLYMRYSDDFVIILPKISEKNAILTLRKIVTNINNTPGLKLQDEKTQFFKYENGTLENCGNRFHVAADCSKKTLDFLGFSFDGQSVSIRAKTTTKYYYKMNRKAKTIRKNGGITHRGNKISAKVLYDRYSIRGAYPDKSNADSPKLDSKKKYNSGNFITYVLRAKKEYGKGNLNEKIIKRHMQKIRKAIEDGQS